MAFSAIQIIEQQANAYFDNFANTLDDLQRLYDETGDVQALECRNRLLSRYQSKPYWGDPASDNNGKSEGRVFMHGDPESKPKAKRNNRAKPARPREEMTFSHKGSVTEGHLTLLYSKLMEEGWIDCIEGDFKALFSGKRDEACTLIWLGKFRNGTLVELFKQYPLYSQDSKKKDAICLCVFFIGKVRWYVLEGQPEGDDFTLFSIVVGLADTEYGYASIKEMESICVDVGHNAAQMPVHLFSRPMLANGILTHLQPRCRHSAGVRSLARRVKDTLFFEQGDGVGGGRHVGTFRHAEASALDKPFGIGKGYFVLGRTRESYIAGNAPGPLARIICRTRILGSVFFDTAAAYVLELEDKSHLFLIKPVRVVYKTVGVGKRHDLGPEPHGLLGCVLRHVSGARHYHRTALERAVPRGKHLLGKVAQTVSRSLGTQQRTTPGQAFSGQSTGKLAFNTLVLAEKISYLAAPHSYVSGRNISILADVTVQFRHKALAETHDLGVGLASRAEIRTALGAAHRKRGQTVLESLLKCEELHYAQVHALMEADTALVRAESAVALHAEAAVDMESTSVVRPGNTEYHYAFRFRNAFKYFLVNEIRICRDVWCYAFSNFTHGLMEFFLAGIACDHIRHKSVKIPFCKIIHMGITTNNAHKTTKKMFLIKGAKELPGQDRREKKSRKPAPMPPGIRRYTC